LLNCFQWGQPGGVDYADDQYAEPCGISPGATWGGGRGKTSVINPYVELTGAQATFSPRGKREQSPPSLNLTVADIPQLAG
jgi:hypothetical protein